jgi:hypothetical protein
MLRSLDTLQEMRADVNVRNSAIGFFEWGNNIRRFNIPPNGALGAETPFGPFLLHDLIESPPCSSL